MGWRSEDYDSYKWVQALKGEQLNKYALVPVKGNYRRLSNQNLPDAIQWFAELVADYLQQKQVTGPILAIPVPSSNCVASSRVRPHTRKLAKAVCDTLKDGSKVLDCLRWKKNLGSASEEGGPRETEILYGNLMILGDQLKDLDESTNVLLLDDVTTSGGHLKACAAKLKKAGVSVELCVCGGKTVYDQNQRAFSLYEYTLDEHKP